MGFSSKIKTPRRAPRAVTSGLQASAPAGTSGKLCQSRSPRPRHFPSPAPAASAVRPARWAARTAAVAHGGGESRGTERPGPLRTTSAATNRAPAPERGRGWAAADQRGGLEEAESGPGAPPAGRLCLALPRGAPAPPPSAGRAAPPAREAKLAERARRQAGLQLRWTDVASEENSTSCSRSRDPCPAGPLGCPSSDASVCGPLLGSKVTEGWRVWQAPWASSASSEASSSLRLTAAPPVATFLGVFGLGDCQGNTPRLLLAALLKLSGGSDRPLSHPSQLLWPI